MSIIKQDYGEIGGGGFDFSTPLCAETLSKAYNSGGFTVAVTGKPKYIIFSAYRNGSGIMQYIFDVDNESTISFLQTPSASGYTEQQYSYFISSVTDSLITFTSNTTTFEGGPSEFVVQAYA